MDCSCDTCQGACKNKPGWFKPGEAEKAADLLGMKFKDFFDQYLAVDFYSLEDEHVWVLAPAVKGMEPGKEFGMNPKGECVFFNDGKCDIHAAKPIECSAYDHTVPHDVIHDLKENDITKSWQEPGPYEQIRILLGREPVPPDHDFKGMAELMFAHLAGGDEIIGTNFGGLLESLKSKDMNSPTDVDEIISELNKQKAIALKKAEQDD